MKLNIDNCDENELKLFKEFQARIEDLGTDVSNSDCLRFLIAREWNLLRAEEMLRNSIAWRKKIGIDNYLSWADFGAPFKDFEFHITGINHNGGPVLWLPVGTWNARYWIERGKQEEATLHSFHILETALRRMKELNNKQVVVIFGIEGLTYYKVSHLPTLKVLYAGFHSLEQNYPEILSNLVVINAPWLFSIAFNFIKPILSQHTLDKIQIFGSEKDKWILALKALIPDTAIPLEYLKDK